MESVERMTDTEVDKSVSENGDVSMETDTESVAKEKENVSGNDTDESAIWPLEEQEKLNKFTTQSQSPESFNVINRSESVSSDSPSSSWSIRSPLPLKPPNSCSSHSFLRRRRSLENRIRKTSGDAPKDGRTSDHLSRPSSFWKKLPQTETTIMEQIERENNLLKRCNSAPLLNDFEMAELSSVYQQHATLGKNRIRRFSATSPVPGTRPTSRLRLHQLKTEESLEGIQTKETAHEREVQATIQISSNWSDLSLKERRTSLDSCLSSPRHLPSPSTTPTHKPHFPIPSSTVSAQKSCHSRAIDFNSSSHTMAALSPNGTSPHPIPHLTPNSGIPSPLTISPCVFNLSPHPPSPTRALCNRGKQCFSPSMQVPVSMARTGSRSPSPSPTRRTFVTRRRSQSPCIMRPSALGSIKRKCDSDNEGSSSPKRCFVPTIPSLATSGASGDFTQTNSSLGHRAVVQRSHSLSSTDNTDIYVLPSPPQPVPLFTHHASHGFHHPLHHTSSPVQPHHAATQMLETTRSSSPASSTCSSSSLEGLRDLQLLTSLSHGGIPQPKKEIKDDKPPISAPTPVDSLS
nr:flocculation protein FLO11 [Ciona intestinalis]|eukprot:XP_026690867.1 flocculation protein FLO11 [Ciona intestinalis]